MFDILSKGFRAARLKLEGKAELTEDAVADALREVRTSLIQADVEIGVAKSFVEQVKQKSLGEIVPIRGPGGQSIRLTPQDWFIKACYDELVALMGPVTTELELGDRPSVILLVGLQGSGKTTTAGKLAKKLRDAGKKPMLVAADIYRPAAVEQLSVLGRKLNLPVFSIKGLDPVQLSKMAVSQARNVGRDVVIIDTAGRLAVDEALMTELERIKAETQPKNILFVCDAMIGQDAVRTAAEFDRRLAFTGFILTKLDGDARGGAALSIKAVTGKPIKFLGEGESLDKLEEFRPEGLAQRILGFGDIVGLVQDFEKHVDKEEAERDAGRMLKGAFSYDDFIKQMQTLRKIGPLREILSRMPMVGQLVEQLPEEALDEGQLDATLAMIRSMTGQERSRPDVLNESRFRRIANGSGHEIEEVRDLHERFIQARSMMKGLGSMLGNPAQLMKMQRQMQQGGGLGGLAQMMGLGGGDGPEAPSRPVLSVDEKLARRKKQKEARKARKRNR